LRQNLNFSIRKFGVESKETLAQQAVFLVPKLCLGTQVREAPLRTVTGTLDSLKADRHSGRWNRSPTGRLTPSRSPMRRKLAMAIKVIIAKRC